MTLIATCGEFEAGKDKFCDIFLEEKKPELVFQRRSFAWGVRKSVECLSEGKIKASDTLSKQGKETELDTQVFGKTVGQVMDRLSKTFEWKTKGVRLPRDQLVKGVEYLESMWLTKDAIAAKYHNENIRLHRFMKTKEKINMLMTVVILILLYSILFRSAYMVSILAFLVWIGLLLVQKVYYKNGPLHRYDNDLFRTTNKRVTVGMLLQILGTEIGRNLFGNDIWIEFLEKEMSADEHTLISDARFKNEVAWLKKQKNSIILLIDARQRLDAIKAIKMESERKDGRDSSHASESELRTIPRSEFSAVLDNNGPVEAFRHTIITCEILAPYLHKHRR